MGLCCCRSSCWSDIERVYESGSMRVVGLEAGLLPSDDVGLSIIPASAILVLKLLPVKGDLGSAARIGLAVTVGDGEVRYLGEADTDDEADAGGRSASSKPASMCAPA